MNLALKKIETQFGPEVANGVRQVLQEQFAQEFDQQLAVLRERLIDSLESFRQNEMLPAGELQRQSYRTLEQKIKAIGKILLLYNSSPSAVIFDLNKLQELVEEIEMHFAVLERLEFLDEGEGVSPSEFWTSLAQARPEA